jgi:hypothetical protein
MADRRLLVRWALANAIGMTLGFLAFVEVPFFLAFGFDFELHWSSDAVAAVTRENPEWAERVLRIALAVGLPLTGAIFTSCQALVLHGLLPRVRTWILTGPLGFAAVILLVWPFTAIWGDIPGPVEPFTIVGGGLTFLASFQWLILRRRNIAARRWLVLWIAGLPLGMVVFIGAYTLIDLVVPISWAAEVALIGFFIGGTAAALSGNALFRALSAAGI